MAKTLRSEIDLPTLRISVDLATSEAVFAAVRGRRRPTEVARCPLADLGLPPSAVEHVRDADLTVPVTVVTRLSAAAENLGTSPLPPHNALWLEFPVPRGLVHVLPWERLLAGLGRPLFRLPFHPVRPQKPGVQLDVAICSSSPFPTVRFDPARVVAELAHQYLDIPGRHVTVHLFTDADRYAATCDAVHPLLGRGDVVVHVPAERDAAARRTIARPGGPHAIANPWLTWILDAVEGGRLDIVHFVAHGHLSDGRGALVLAGSPASNDGPATFVEAVEVIELLTRVGAVGLALSDPPGSDSAAGLRDLADYVAQSRPGVTAVHDVAADPGGEQLARSLRTALTPSGPLTAPFPAMTAWVHPLFVEVVRDPEPAGEPLTTDLRELTDGLMLRKDGRSAFLHEATRKAAVEVDGDSWVASASRSIEHLQMSWLPYTADLPVDQAAVDALNRVSALLERHVHLAYPEEPEPPEGSSR
ncbi:hypothetical protein [Promicromonospora sp. MEB111]|uniref:hypothetical protein n=1 Tax=Promicromonospora sp. MEB111 TaxID=3040301 RepID=UPI00254CC413|nr:hypothetical protein [Promicromonospora sp. MEB111]